jgi:large subunit ribosomal protein L1
VPKHGKSYRNASEAVEDRAYIASEAIELAKGQAFAKFDEGLDLSVRLGVDPKHSDQMVRGTVVLPHGTGKEARILVFASGEKVKEAEEAGADHVGGEEMAAKVAGGWLDFDAVVSTPDMMKEVGKLGRVLGPRGLMPNPKAGTVTFDVAKAVGEIKAGKVEFRVDKSGVMHAPFGRVSFESGALQANLAALVGAILRARPSSSKGRYVEAATISSTMGPGIRLDETSVTAETEG